MEIFKGIVTDVLTVLYQPFWFAVVCDIHLVFYMHAYQPTDIDNELIFRCSEHYRDGDGTWNKLGTDLCRFHVVLQQFLLDMQTDMREVFVIRVGFCFTDKRYRLSAECAWTR